MVTCPSHHSRLIVQVHIYKSSRKNNQLRPTNLKSTCYNIRVRLRHPTNPISVILSDRLTIGPHPLSTTTPQYTQSIAETKMSRPCYTSRLKHNHNNNNNKTRNKETSQRQFITGLNRINLGPNDPFGSWSAVRAKQSTTRDQRVSVGSTRNQYTPNGLEVSFYLIRARDNHANTNHEPRWAPNVLESLLRPTCLG